MTTNTSALPRPRMAPYAFALRVHRPPSPPNTPRNRMAFILSWFTTIRTLNTLFCFFASITFVAGATFALLSLLWLFPSSTIVPSSLPPSAYPSITSLLLPHLDILSLLLTSLILLLSFLASIPSILSRKTTLLSILNLSLTLDVLLIIASGGILWWRSLRTRMTFWNVWLNDNGTVGRTIQDAFECCGYFDPSEAILGTTTCPNVAVASGMKTCVEPFTNHANYVLNGLSTAMFAMAGVMSVWIVVNACIVSERKLQERFKQIEEKHRHSTWVV